MMIFEMESNSYKIAVCSFIFLDFILFFFFSESWNLEISELLIFGP